MLLGLRGAVNLNLVWASVIVKEQRLGESPGRFAFPAWLASRQPLFVLLALPPLPPTLYNRPPPLKPTSPRQLKKVEKVTDAARTNRRGEHESSGERRDRGTFREADRKWNESEMSVREEWRKKT